jgi:hypothetical protein
LELSRANNHNISASTAGAGPMTTGDSYANWLRSNPGPGSSGFEKSAFGSLSRAGVRTVELDAQAAIGDLRAREKT